MRLSSNIKRRVLTVAASLIFPVLGWSQPFGYAINSDDAQQADQLLRINLTTGQHEFIGELPTFLADVEGLAFSEDGSLFGADDSSKSLIRINLSNADAVVVDNRQFNLGFGPGSSLDFGMSFACDNTLLLVAEDTQSLYQVDIDSGMAQLIGESGGLGDRMSAIASFGQTVVSFAPDTGIFYRVDVSNGTSEQLAVIDELGGENMDAGLSFDESGNLWVVISDAFSEQPSKIYQVNLADGTAQLISESRTGIESLAIGPPATCDVLGPQLPRPVPALSTYGLLIMISAVMLITLVRSRNRT